MRCCPLDKCQDFGLLLLRLGLGGVFIVMHGWGKITDPGKWEWLGSQIGDLGLPVVAPKFFGFMAAFAEFGGGILLVLGLLFRPAAFLLLCVMIVAVAHHATAEPPESFNHPLEVGIVFLALVFIGPGRFALDSLCKRLWCKPKPEVA